MTTPEVPVPRQQADVDPNELMLSDAPAFFFAPDRGLGDRHVIGFLRWRPIGWELRQACELALLARNEGVGERARAVELYLRGLARRMVARDDASVEATRVYAARLCAASQGRPWASAASQVAGALAEVAPPPGLKSRAFGDYRGEHLLCVRNVVGWLSWLERRGATSDPVHQDEALRPRPQYVANLLGLNGELNYPVNFSDAPTGAAWRKWFAIPGHSNETTGLWFVPDTLMSRARQFVWHCLHDAAHLFHQHLLSRDARVLTLGTYPYWRVTEAFACWVEHRAFSVLVNDEGGSLSQTIDELDLDLDEVLTVLIEGFIEREGRFYRALVRDGVASLDDRGVPAELSAAARSASAVDFDSLPSITWYYARGYKAFDVPVGRLSALLRFAEPFQHH